MDVVQLVKDGKGIFEYAPVRISDDRGNMLVEQVFRDGMKFDDLPSMKWNRKPIAGDDRRWDGVRLGMTGIEMQKICYLLNCMMLTPKEHDHTWDEAGKTGTRFDMAGMVPGTKWVNGQAVNTGKTITAVANIHDNHVHLEKAIAKAGGDKGGHICVVGKYWVLCNALFTRKFATRKDSKGRPLPNIQAINYGWYSKEAKYKSVTGIYRVYQDIGGAHPDSHFDPSQLCKLKYRWALLIPKGEEPREVDLYELSQDPKWCHLVSHEGPLKTVWLPSTPPPADDESADYPKPELVA